MNNISLNKEMPLVEVKNLTTTFKTPYGEIDVVNGVDFLIKRGEALGIVGESGSGKTVTSLTLMGLLPHAARVTKGEINLDGEDVTKMSADKHRKLRGSKMAMIFQDPMSSLSPFYTVGWQIKEMILNHQKNISKLEAHKQALQLLNDVGIPDPNYRINQFPHQFSGGMRQRIMIAMAMANSPELLIADEPTTALDVTIQAQVLALMAEKRRERNMALMLISHDWGVVSALCDRIAVMYGGKMVEIGTALELWKEPKHPYTKALLKSVPHWGTKKEDELFVIKGQPPVFDKNSVGCPFANRCHEVEEKCFQETPPLITLGDRRNYRCFH